MSIDPHMLRHFFIIHADWVFEISWTILAMGMLQNFIYLIQIPAAFLELRKYSQVEDSESSWQLLISGSAMPISLLVPAYNEEAGIVESVHSMLALEYPDVEVIVVNDGSKDRTLMKLIETFALTPVTLAHELAVPHAAVRQVYKSSLYPNLVVVDKENGGGKADALNAGINFCRNPLFCVVDGDSLLETESLLRAVRPFMENPRRMVAVGGTIRIANGCEVKNGHVRKVNLPGRILPLVQSLEYIRAFLVARLALSRAGILTIISGAFGIFRRSVAVEVGGFSHGTVGEDFDLVIKMHRLLHDQKRDYLMRYVPEPVCWTEVPENLKVLRTQRTRWERGALEVFFKHSDMLLNPKYGRIGMLGFSHVLVVDVLGPIVEVLGYAFIPLFYVTGFLSLPFLLAYTGVTFIFGIFVSTAALILEEMELQRVPRARDLLTLTAVAVIENFGYRQLNTIWRVIGWWQFLARKKGWGTMTRIGFQGLMKGKNAVLPQTAIKK